MATPVPVHCPTKEMLVQERFEEWRDYFKAQDIQKQYNLLSEFRDSMDCCLNPPERYEKFLKICFKPCFLQTLRQIPVQFTASPQQKLRNYILETINRLPANVDEFGPYARELLHFIMGLLRTENETNAIVCLRLIIDIHKNYRQFRQVLEEFVQPFLDFVLDAYNNLKETVRITFSEPAPEGINPGMHPSMHTTMNGGMNNLSSGMHSGVHSGGMHSGAGVPTGISGMPMSSMHPGVSMPGMPGGIHSGMHPGMHPGLPMHNTGIQGGMPAMASGMPGAMPSGMPTIPNTMPTGMHGGGMHAGMNAGLNAMLTGPGGPPGPEKAQTTILTSVRSFKVLTECPIIVVLLFQLYGRTAQNNVTKFIPLIVGCLNITDTQCRKSHPSLYQDFIGAQVKTLSFLAYMLRQYANMLQRYKDNIPQCVIKLLKNCPPEATATRKELLIATRHILATDFRIGFVEHLDILLKEDLMIGTGRTCYETLRPLAYSTLADLVHHVRMDLGLEQIANVVYLYSLHIHDNTLPFSIQIMSAKLLLNLVECIARKPGGRPHLIRILDTFVNKFTSLKSQIPDFLQQKEIRHENTDVVLSSNVVKDCQLLMKTLVLGLKNIVWGIGSPTGFSQGQGPQGQPKQASMEESLIFRRLLRHGLKCFEIYSSAPMPLRQDEKDILDHFAGIFTMVEKPIFQDIMSTQIEYLYDCMVKNQTMLAIPQHFLANPDISRLFADILLNFLISRMGELGGGDAEILLQLFKLVFRSVSIFPENEPILQPHLAPIITESMKWASLVKDSSNYFYLLRDLFRSIANGKFNEFAKEFLPLLSSLLDGLNALQESAHPPHLRELFIELSLRVPVRLSALLPCLKLLMRPLILALETDGGDLCTLGLRLLEVCVDKLGKDFLEPFLGNMKPRLMRALWKHLRPPPYKHTPQVLRIMGKMAGRNRNFFDHPPELSTAKHLESGLTVLLTLEPDHVVELPLEDAVYSAQKLLLSNTKKKPFSKEWRKDAFEFFKTCMAGLLNPEGISLFRDIAVKGDAEDGKSPSKYPRFVEVMDPDSVTLIKTKSRLDAEVEIVKVILTSLLMAAADEDFKEEAKLFLDGITTHFGLLFAAKRQLSTAKLNEINPLVFIDALVQVLTDENRAYAEVATKQLDVLIEVVEIFFGDKQKASQLPVFEELADRVCQSCSKREWHHKAGGCIGIGYLSSRLDVGWVRRHQIDFIKALLLVLNDLSPSVSVGTVEDAGSTLASVIKICNSRGGESSGEEQKKCLDAIVALLISQLPAPNPRVRKNVQISLETLADITLNDITDLLKPLINDELLQPIFSQPLQTLPRVVQTGYLDAIAFCLNLRPPLLKLTPQMVQLIQDALAIANSDDSLPPTQRHAHSVNQRIAQRITIIELLAAAMACPEFKEKNKQFEDLGHQIIGHFFQSLTLRSEQIVNVAKRGLEQVISIQTLPKELLKSSLRPILLNLADYRKLSVPLLEGLARLLDLLRQCFNVALGDKLLEHLQKWHEPDNILGAKVWRHNDIIRIPTAIMEIFHLLPPQASKFLVELVRITIDLEANLPKGHLPKVLDSPFRSPLTKFLNRYPMEAFNYFLSHLEDRPTRQLFWFIIRSKEAVSLRQELAKLPDLLIQYTFRTTITQQPVRSEMQFQGILIIRALLKYTQDLLEKNKQLLNCLLEIWNSPDRLRRLQNEGQLPLHQLKESKLLIKCFKEYCMRRKEETQLLFEMLSIFVHKSSTDYSFLETFYKDYVPENYGMDLKLTLLQGFFEFFKNCSRNLQYDHATVAIRLLLMPLIEKGITTEQDKEMVSNRIISHLLGTDGTDGILPTKAESIYPNTALNVELLHVCTLLIKNYHTTVGTTSRKKLIQFAWLHLKNEDTTTAQSAYVCVCCFIKWFDTPPKIIFQVYCQLLKAHQPEARGLVREGLNILVPVLNEKLLSLSPNSPTPIWINCTRRVMIEDQHSIPQVVHILQLIVRHPDLFYSFRQQFVGAMISALPKIGLIHNASIENKKLSLSIVELIINWEQKRRTELKGDTTKRTPKKSEDGSWTPKIQRIEVTANFLIRMIATNFRTEPAGINGRNDYELNISTEAEDLLRHMLSVWPQSTLRLDLFEKLFVSEQDNTKLIAIGLRILTLICEFQIDSFVPKHASALAKHLLPALRSEDSEITTLVADLLANLFKAYPNKDDPAIAEIYQTITDLIKQNLSSEKVMKNLTLLSTLTKAKSDYIFEFHSHFVKLIERLVQEHLQEDTARQQSMMHQKTQPKSEFTMLWGCISLFSDHIKTIPTESTNKFFKQILFLLERSTDEELLINVITHIKPWMTDGPDGKLMDPNIRVEYLQKLKRFQKVRSVELHTAFLDLMYSIYQDPSTTQDEKVRHLKGTVLIGLMSRNPELRKKFFQTINEETEKDLEHRFSLIMSTETWESIGHIYWIQQALDLILGLHVPASAFKLSPVSGSVIPLAHSTKAKKKTKTGPIENPLKDLLDRHEQFLEEVKSLKATSLIESLQSLLHDDPELAHKLWVTLFPSLWAIIKPATRRQIEEILPQLLGCSHFLKQSRIFPNVIQSLLYGINKCVHPAPIDLNPPIVNYCAKTFNCWHLGIRMLEERLAAQLPEPSDSVFMNLNNLYRSLSEEDLSYGMCYQQSVVEDSKSAVVYGQMGMWQKAQQVLTIVQQDAEQGLIPYVPTQEQELWRVQWEDCCRRLNQWELLSEFARANKRNDLLIHTSWKLGEWDTMREAFQLCHSVHTESPQIKILQSFLSLQENRIVEVDHLCKQAMNVLVNQWIGLPHIPSIAHTPMLQSFQKIIELYESAKIVKDLSPDQRARSQNKLHEVRGILNTWRQRLPNEWDDILHWNDLLQWRQHVFALIIDAYKSETDKTMQNLAYAETAWAINKFSQIARYQGLVELCLDSLRKINDMPTVPMNDAFIQRKEQIKCYFKLPKFYHIGADIINETNLDCYMDPPQKAELYQLKGELLCRMGCHEEGDRAFAISVSMYKYLDHSWIGWGKFWDSQYQQPGAASPQQRALYAQYAVNCYLQGVKCNNHQSRGWLARVLWLISQASSEIAMTTKSEDPNLVSTGTKPSRKRERPSMGNSPNKRLCLSKIGVDEIEEDEVDDSNEEGTPKELQSSPNEEKTTTSEPTVPPTGDTVATNDDVAAAMVVVESAAMTLVPVPDTHVGGNLDQNKEDVVTMFAKHSDCMPEWLWITWITELLNGLNKPHAKEFKALLLKVAKKYPQAIFYELGNYIQQKTQQTVIKPKARGGRRTVAPTPQDTPVSLTHAVDVMNIMKTTHPALCSNLARMTESIALAFLPRPEEDLLCHLQDVLVMSYGCVTPTKRYQIWKKLHAIYDLMFVLTNSGEVVDAASNFCKKFKNSYTKELLTDSAEELKIPQLITRLKTHIASLEALVNKIPSTQPLEQLSSFLASFQNDSVQVPSQFTSIMEPNPDENHLIDKFESQVIIVKSGRVPKRVISMRGSNGEAFNFFVETSHRKPSPSSLKIDDGSLANSRRKTSQDDKISVPIYDPSWDSEARFAKLLRYFNVLFKKMNMQARKRHIYLPVSKFVPISPNVRLVGTSEEVVPYEDIYRHWCDSNGKEFYLPLEQYRNEMENTPTDPKIFNDRRKEVFRHIGEEHVAPSIFTDYVYSKLCQDYDGVWHFKKHFITQLSVCSLVGYLFSTEKRSLFNCAISPQSAQILNRNFYPQYGSSGLLSQPLFLGTNNDFQFPVQDPDPPIPASLDDSTSVPFLLSNNMRYFIGPTAIHGLFSTVMLASVLTLGESDVMVQVKDRLRLYFQDDIVEWAQHFKDESLEQEVVHYVEKNTTNITNKILALTPIIRADAEVDSSVPINSQVVELLDAAILPENMSRVSVEYFPWF